MTPEQVAAAIVANAVKGRKLTSRHPLDVGYLQRAITKSIYDAIAAERRSIAPLLDEATELLWTLSIEHERRSKQAFRILKEIKERIST